MKYQQLDKLTQNIKNCPLWNLESPPCGRSEVIPPVINELLPTQKYLIISSDPTSGTDKSGGIDTPASGFASRFLALLFLGNDSNDNTELILKHYSILYKIFIKNFYWTHYCKCHAFGNPKSFCAKKYLRTEIELFFPAKLIISLGSKPIDFLLGKKSLKSRVNRVLHYEGIPIIASLHPSRNWNLNRRGEYSFYETWKLIRDHLLFDEDDSKTLMELKMFN